MIVWNYGGGIQSAAIGVLVREGSLPKPDLAVIADTSRERRTTWDYLHGVMQPYLNSIGLKIEIASHKLARVDLYDSNGLTIMPAYTTEGRLSAFCSGEWKRDVIMRWLRLQRVKECTQWIGYSIDEMRRVPENDRAKWCKMEFPLIDRMINRAMCKRLIEAAGLPVPSKSRCWCCPHMNAEEWAETLAEPVDGPLAVSLDREVRANDPQQKGLFLHYSRQPLQLVAAGTATESISLPIRACEGAHCWT